ncbi:MAG: hypothetical protein S4CHLAM7_04920 [Chlamydiae bacterium]|nr:hypothetical protein [Chlamydiota bacterium]
MNAKFIAIDGPEKGHEFLLDTGKEWIFGRDPNSCQFVLSDPRVSRQHARIREEGGHYFILNLSDTNPIRIGDSDLTKETRLYYEDKVKIGDSWFKFTEPKDPSTETKSSEYDNFFEETDVPDDLVPGLTSPAHSSQDKPDDSERNDESEDPSPSKNHKNKARKSDKEDERYDTIFEDLGDQDTFNDLSEKYMGSERFILKVLAGPNAGAEFAMQKGRSYVIGTDVAGADIIFNDLSVSRHHARLSISDEPEVFIEDLDSRNGVIVDGELVQGQQEIASKNMITLGTTTFVIIDRERGEETYVAERPVVDTKNQEEEKPEKEAVKEESSSEKKTIRESTFILTGILVAIIVVLGVGAVTLFKSSPVERPKLDFTKEIQLALGNNYPDIKYTYNSNSGTLFLVGHVLTTVDKEELLYNLNNLGFIAQIDDNVVIDDDVAQEMNQVLSRNPIWRSISIHSPQPGRFVLSGYLPTNEEGAELEDFVNVQFPYVDRLSNYVVIESDLNQDVLSKLHNYGFYSVQVELSNGDISLAGYVNASYEKAFEKTIREISRIVGVRNVNNYVVIVGQGKNGVGSVPALPYKSEGSPGSIGQEGEPAQSAKVIEKTFGSWLGDSSVVNVTDYQSETMDVSYMYTVSGYADQGPVGRAVVIKGRILTVGDYLNGMRVLAIFENYVFLEKNGLKYKIEFNR